MPSYLLRYLLVFCLLTGAAWAESPSWQPVSRKTKPDGYYLPLAVTTSAEQAVLDTAHLTGPTWYGYGGPQNVHTRHLRFLCQGVQYAVPQSFVGDLLRLRVREYATRVTRNDRDLVFSVRGADGEKGYQAHFHFRDGKFRQRILLYTEAQRVLIRTHEG